MLLRKTTWVLACVCLLALSACTQINTASHSVDKPIKSKVSKTTGWGQRQLVLSRKQSWNLNSKISLRFSDENWIFGLKWKQRSKSQYQMDISNPLTGAIVARLNRHHQGVTLLSRDGKTYRDTDEERLLRSQTNLNIPVKGLQYWVRGLTSPQYKLEKLELDTFGRPRTISQAGWKIRYASYLSNSANAMPRKITLTRINDDLYLKIIAKAWY
jgi:outer membrane lipoprotein LolB